MADPFLSEIKIVSFDFAPQGYAFCNGQLLPINQNPDLFSLIGTTYGGDGVNTFALPDLRGRTPIHFNEQHPLGEAKGEQSHALAMTELATHTHQLNAANNAADTNTPTNTTYLGVQNNTYSPAANLVTMAVDEITDIGGGQPHQNMQPFLTLNFCIALQGTFPTQI